MPKNTNKSTTKINKILPTLLQFNYLSTIPLFYHLKLDFYTKIQLPALHLSSANWLFTIKHLHFSVPYDVTGSRINVDTLQFDVDQFCVDFVLN